MSGSLRSSFRMYRIPSPEVETQGPSTACGLRLTPLGMTNLMCWIYGALVGRRQRCALLLRKASDPLLGQGM